MNKSIFYTALVLAGLTTGTTFAQASFKLTTPLEGRALESPIPVDLNGDGRSDLVTSRTINVDSMAIDAHLNNGDATFRLPIVSKFKAKPGSITSGDYNKDGKTDIALVRSVDWAVDAMNWGTKLVITILYGDAKGGFSFAKESVNEVSRGSYMSIVTSEDVNKDAIPDFVIAFGNARYGASVSVFLGKATGDFVYTSGMSSPRPGISGISSGDFNKDGNVDFIVSSGNEFNSYLGDGMGKFTFKSYFANYSYSTDPAASADFNRDGRVDLLTFDPRYNSDSLLFIPGNGTGEFGTPQFITLGVGAKSISKGDYNSDGWTDLAFISTSETDPNVYVMLNQATGLFAKPVAFSIGKPTSGLQTADFNGDKKADLFSANRILINTPTTATPTTFFRALNLNGPSLTIDGKTFQSSTGAVNFTFSGYKFANQNIALKPATDANRAQMIRSSIWGKNVALNVGGVPAGTYDVYVYVWEDNYAQTFSIALEGSVVVSNYNSGTAGTWKKLGPFRKTITDGTLNITSFGGDANFSGLEIDKVNTTTARENVVAAKEAAEQDNDALAVVPNPAIGGLFSVYATGLAANAEAQVALQDLAGKVVWLQTLQTTGNGKLILPVNETSLKPGLYILTLNAANKRQSTKVIIQ